MPLYRLKFEVSETFAKYSNYIINIILSIKIGVQVRTRRCRKTIAKRARYILTNRDGLWFLFVVVVVVCIRCICEQ